jgi:Arc/MetJ-type ribon-helix-helix transcriptional regulator
MPVIRGKPKEQISYKCPHDLLGKINIAIEKGEYASRNDVITAALRLLFDNKENLSKNQAKEWLTSKDGEDWMNSLIKKNIERKH